MEFAYIGPRSGSVGDVRSGFFSPEPWVGLQNSLVQRQGLVFVDPGEEFVWVVRIERESSS